MNKFFKILGKADFIGLIIGVVGHVVLWIGIIMKDKYGIHNGFTNFMSDTSERISEGLHAAARFFESD